MDDQTQDIYKYSWPPGWHKQLANVCKVARLIACADIDNNYWISPVRARICATHTRDNAGRSYIGN